MWLFKKKPQETGRGEAPVNKVVSMSNQGLHENDVSSNLKQEGYSEPEIHSAMMTAVKEGVTQQRQQPAQQQQPEFQAPEPEPTGYDFPVENQEPQPAPEWEPSMPEMGTIPVALSGTPGATEIEEVVEAVVEEKWKQLEFRIDAIEKRFDAVNERLHDIDLQMRTIKESSHFATGGIEGKIDQYRENIDQIDARIGSIEKAFKETLPSMIESVRSVNDTLQKMGNKQ
ncbi:MAG: hypothetical protein V1836_03615 [Candidatus Aenigmatarchaeota archaeon]